MKRERGEMEVEEEDRKGLNGEEERGERERDGLIGTKLKWEGVGKSEDGVFEEGLRRKYEDTREKKNWRK